MKKNLLAQIAPDFRIDMRGIPILSIGELLTFLLRGIFILAGILALIYALWGGLSWIISGGEKDKIQAARDKIQAAIVGIFVLIVVLSIMWTLETAVFRRSICFGISCPINIPGLNITPLPGNGGASNTTNPSGQNASSNTTTSQQQNAGDSNQNAATLSQVPSTIDRLPQTGGR